MKIPNHFGLLFFIFAIAFLSCKDDEVKPLSSADYIGTYRMEDFDATLNIVLLDTSVVLPIMSFPEIEFKANETAEADKLNVDLTEFVNDVSLSFLILFGADIDPIEISEEIQAKITAEGFKIKGFTFIIPQESRDPIQGSFIADGRLDGTQILMNYKLYLLIPGYDSGPLTFEGLAIGEKQ